MKKFDHEVAELERRLGDMGDLARSMVVLAASAVKDQSVDVHAEISQKERLMDEMQTAIDQDAIRMLTVFGPVAKDLRYLLVCTHITAHLERMGDQAVNVVQALELMGDVAADHPTLQSLRRMSDLACEMVDSALDAYFSRDATKATATRIRDDMVDTLNDQVMKEVLTEDVLLKSPSNAGDIGSLVAQVLIASDLERIADQAKNICKQVIYLVQGHDVRHIRPQPEDAQGTGSPGQTPVDGD